MSDETKTANECCGCSCDCACCREGKCAAPQTEPDKNSRDINWNMRVTDSIGSIFLGVLAILMLVFLVRSNKRNRELLLEVIQLRRQ